MNQISKRIQAELLVNSAPGLMATLKVQEAIEAYHKALAIAEEIGDKHLEAVCCCSLGNAYTLPRNYDEARKYLNRALSIPGGTIDMMKVQTNAHCYLGEIYVALKDYGEARKQGEKALSLAKKLNTNEDLGKAYLVLADVYRTSSDYDKAIAHYKKALETASKTGAKYLEHSCRFRLGEIVISKITSGKSVSASEQREALQNLESAVRIAREIGSEQAAAEGLFYCGRLCLATGQDDEAIKHYLAAEPAFKAAGRTSNLKILYGQMAIAYERKGQASQAKKYKDMSR